jgi:hypothetical protein
MTMRKGQCGLKAAIAGLGARPSLAWLSRVPFAHRLRSENQVEDSEYDEQPDQENDTDDPANDLEHRHLWRDSDPQ